MPKKFLRSQAHARVNLGCRQKSKQKYVKAKGRHNKIRQSRKGRPVKVQVGFKGEIAKRGLIENKMPVRIWNIRGLENLKDGEIAIMGKIGRKRKLEIAKYSVEKNIKVINLNSRKVLRKFDKEKSKASKEEKTNEKSK